MGCGLCDSIRDGVVITACGYDEFSYRAGRLSPSHCTGMLPPSRDVYISMGAYHENAGGPPDPAVVYWWHAM